MSLGFGICNLEFEKVRIGLFVAIMGILVACSGEKVPDCFQGTGDIVRQVVDVPEFSKITVFENVELIIKSGETQRVEVETGEYLRDEVGFRVEGDRLVLNDNNNCNLFREYGSTRIYVTAPNITEIRSSTGFPIRSDGPLTYDELTLYSESFTEGSSETTDGSFELELATQNLMVVANGIAFFKLSGNTNTLRVTIGAGDSRVDAQDLLSQHVMFNHRGSNDILIYPQESLSGVIRGTGDVVSFNRPPNIDIQQLFSGQLIFQ